MKLSGFIISILLSLPAIGQERDAQGNPAGPLMHGNPVTRMHYNPTLPMYDSIRPLTELNTASADAYPWISADGLRIYYTSTLTSGQGLVTASRNSLSDPFGPASYLGGNFSTAVSCWLTHDELTIYYTNGNSLYRATRLNLWDSFGGGSIVTLSGAPALTFITAPSLTPALDQLYLYCSNTAGKHLYRFTGSGTSYNFDGELFHTGESSPGQLSRNGLQMFTSSASSTGSELGVFGRDLLTEPLDSFQLMSPLVNGIAPYTFQPSATAGEGIMVMVKNMLDTWMDNDLYIAWNSSIISASSDFPVGDITVYPNPASEFIRFSLKPEMNGSVVTVYDLAGRLVQESSLARTTNILDVSAFTPGLYHFRIRSDAGICPGTFVKQ
jgi:hypothetical protein